MPDPNTPSVLWNAMIVPYTNFTLKGATWYQAESNTNGFGGPQMYPCLFSGMITAWRQLLNNPTLPFLFVQLAPWNNSAEGGPQFALSQMRVAQQLAQAITPFSGFASAIDLGDIDSPDNNIHPRDKQDVGSRLALVGEDLIYGADVVSTGPVFTLAEVVSDSPPTVRVTFDTNSVGTGLMLMNNQAKNCPSDLGDFAQECGFPSIQLSNGNWYNCTLVLSQPNQDYVDFVLPSHSGSVISNEVTGVMYAYADFPICAIYNSAMLPALPFQWVAEE